MAIIRSFVCPMCGHKFFTLRALSEHLKGHGK